MDSESFNGGHNDRKYTNVFASLIASKFERKKLSHYTITTKLNAIQSNEEKKIHLHSTLIQFDSRSLKKNAIS